MFLQPFRELDSCAHMLTISLVLKYKFTSVAGACVGVALLPTAVWPSSEDWVSDLRRYISGLITARVAKQLHQIGPSGFRGGLVVQPAIVKPVMDLHLPPVNLWPSDFDRTSMLHTACWTLWAINPTDIHNKKKCIQRVIYKQKYSDCTEFL